MIDAVLSYLGRGLVDGTVLALITGVAVMTVFRRARPALLCALWTVVLVKFVVPFGPGLPVSLSGLLDGALPEATAPAATAMASAAGPAAATAAGAAASASSLWLIAKLVLVLSWALIALALIARAVLRHRAAFAAAQKLPAATDETAEAVVRAAGCAGLSAVPDVRECESASSPYLLGLRRPILVVPRWLSAAPRARDVAVVHELAHLRRKDHWLRAVEIGIRSLLFFWPVVGWACRRIEVQREMACDEWACASRKMDRLSYARFLVAVARRASERRRAPGASMALVRTRSELESRVDSLITRSSKPRVGIALGAMLLVWAAIGLGGASASTSESGADGVLCAVEPGLGTQIMAVHPEADRDGDGILSKREICAHQLRMKRKLIDGVIDAELISRIDPAADLDSDGELSDWEIEFFKDQVDIAVVGEDAGLVLQHQRSVVPLSRANVRLESASVPAPVCESERCSDDVVAGDTRLLIGVDFSPR